jgi:hypothetical protein
MSGKFMPGEIAGMIDAQGIHITTQNDKTALALAASISLQDTCTMDGQAGKMYWVGLIVV